MKEVIKLIWTSMLFTSLMGVEAIAVGYKVEYIITFSAIITIIWAFLILSRSLFVKFSYFHSEQALECV